MLGLGIGVCDWGVVLGAYITKFFLTLNGPLLAERRRRRKKGAAR